MDGVLSDASRRQHYLDRPFRDWEAFFQACGDDDLIAEVARLLDVLDSELSVVLLTARPIRVQPQTLAWLRRYELRWDLLDHARLRRLRRVTRLQAASRSPSCGATGSTCCSPSRTTRRNVDMFHSEGIPCVYIHSGYYE